MTRLRATLLTLLAMVVGAALLFQAFQQRINQGLFALGLSDDVRAKLEASKADLRQLARLDPAGEADYRRRFEAIQVLLERSLIVEENQRAIVRRYELLLLGLLVGTIAVSAGFLFWRASRDEERLVQVGSALADLAGGRTDLELGEKGRDAIGRIARMIEETSRRMARDQRRLRSLENLSAWQEAARRHAHEMRTPLTGARLELERAESLLEGERQAAETLEEVRRGLRGARQELERLARFTRAFTSFAKLPAPHRVELDLAAFCREFAATFAAAWPNLSIACAAPPAEGLPPVRADRDMLRQVLVNLCDNASLAIGEGSGQVQLRLSCRGPCLQLDVADDGPGVAAEIRGRIFEPYTTTRKIGEGMGLGLAICRKILLDHGGDLELAATAENDRGATFRLSLPIEIISELR
jgi:two-component system, NtrC family, nitrogen regulation sensor histidine kinase NtrY